MTSSRWSRASVVGDPGGPTGVVVVAQPAGLGGDFKSATVGTSPAFSFGSSVCEVEVDTETGQVRIVRFTDAHDSGTVINPVAFHGQVEGSIVMGVGEVLSETGFPARRLELEITESSEPWAEVEGVMIHEPELIALARKTAPAAGPRPGPGPRPVKGPAKQPTKQADEIKIKASLPNHDAHLFIMRCSFPS